MLKNTILLLLILVISSCATYETQYKNENHDVFPENAAIHKTFYLIGDAGKSPMGGKSDGLLALENHIAQYKTNDAHLIFLGDNIYPVGMPDKNDDFRESAENHLNAQINVASQFKGRTIFIPGNHDWYNEGLKNIEREKKYIEKALEDQNIWEPKVGCPLESKELTPEIQLIIMDSQWFLEKWDNHPTINDNCDQIKTREQLFLEIEGEFKKNQDKTILFVLHHPLFTNGVHGGQYAASKHLFPTQRNIPLPGLASLVNLIRTSGGVSAQDKQNERYQYMVNRITTLARTSQASRIIFASGHEHTLQYIENDGIRQIVSGSGSKKSYATLNNDGLFAYGGKGFARLDILEDGSSWVRYYDLFDGKDRLLYTVKSVDAPPVYNMEQLVENDSAFAKASIYKPDATEVSDAYESVWGTKYRELYGMNIKVPVAHLDTLYGGLEVVRAGGGHQTRALRLQSKDGREYNIRALRKSAVQFLQTTVFKENTIVKDFEDTGAEELILDFYTAGHPFAAVTVAGLADAVGIYHTNPQIFYLPKQKTLGKYNSEYGDELYLLVERPEKNHKNLESFGKPDDIESTATVFEKLREDEKYKIDEPAYVRARMFDMLLGDWDRHQDQWRWSEFELKDGTHLFRPIPRDRDQAYSNFDGALFSSLRALVKSTRQFATYDEDINDIRWFNTAATYLDRSLAQNSNRDVWIEQATYIENQLTDTAIDEAFKALPEEVYNHPSTARIIKVMKSRRGKLVNIASRYYEHLSKLGIIRGTDKDDIIEIDRIDNGRTQVSVYRNKDGKKADLVAQRIFYKKETEEIWIYALDDDDIITDIGSGKNPVKVRIIGGQNNDTYDFTNGKKITIYDHKSKKNTLKNIKKSKLRLRDDYEINLYDPRKTIFRINTTTPSLGFNPDDGFRIGVQNTYTVKGFNRNPNTIIHRIKLGYYFATQGYDIEYNGEFAGIFNKANLLVRGRFASPNFAENFFGFGNETQNLQDELEFDFNRVRIAESTIGLGISYNGEYGSNLIVIGSLQGFEIAPNEERFINEFEDNLANAEFYDRKWFIDLSTTYNYESYDDVLNPTRGMLFESTLGGTYNLQENTRSYGYIQPKLGFYNAISRNRKWVLKSTIQGQINIGDDFEFFQSAQLGQNTGLRGYRTQRFSGQRSFAASGDLRYSFKKFKTGFAPLQMGIFAGADVGRVWLDGDFSEQWHNDIGLGFWVNSASALGGTFNLFHGDDGFRFSFQLGLNF